MSKPFASILVVEDNRDIREILKEALEDRGYSVLEAADGLDGLAHLRAAATLPDLILLDVMMPRMNGVQFREEMMKVAEWTAIPVLLLTADAHAREKAAAMAVRGYLRKPVKLDELFTTMASLLGHPE